LATKKTYFPSCAIAVDFSVIIGFFNKNLFILLSTGC
jgi:hypothetical protein